jgi:ribosomal protein S19E (S16A)
MLQIKLPQWVDIVKTGAFKELAPYDPDWYYIRAGNLQHHLAHSEPFSCRTCGSGNGHVQWTSKLQAVISCSLTLQSGATSVSVTTTLPCAASLARKVYLRQGVGVGAFRKQYGGRNKRKGAVPEHFAKASGGLIRHILIQLETEGLVEKYEGKKGGRKITSTGQRDLDLIAGRIQAAEEPEEEEEDAE